MKGRSQRILNTNNEIEILCQEILNLSKEMSGLESSDSIDEEIILKPKTVKSPKQTKTTLVRRQKDLYKIETVKEYDDDFDDLFPEPKSPKLTKKAPPLRDRFYESAIKRKQFIELEKKKKESLEFEECTFKPQKSAVADWTARSSHVYNCSQVPKYKTRGYVLSESEKYIENAGYRRDFMYRQNHTRRDARKITNAITNDSGASKAYV